MPVQRAASGCTSPVPPAAPGSRRRAPALKIVGRIEDEASQALDDCDLMLFPGSVQRPHPIARFHDRGAVATGYLDTSAVASSHS
jgi:hypothetical protein